MGQVGKMTLSPVVQNALACLRTQDPFETLQTIIGQDDHDEMLTGLIRVSGILGTSYRERGAPKNCF